jgi:hypothetical protein
MHVYGPEIAGSPGRVGVVKGVRPQNPLLVAAVGQLIVNYVWIFVTTVLIKTSYIYSSNYIYS